MAWRACPACVVSCVCVLYRRLPNRGQGGQGALPVQWRGRLVEASVGAGLAPSGMHEMAPKGSRSGSRPRTHPAAAREAQLTCSEEPAKTGWLAPGARRTQNQASSRFAARASNQLPRSTPTHTLSYTLTATPTHASIHTYYHHHYSYQPTTTRHFLTTHDCRHTTTSSPPPSAYGLAIPPGYIANHRPILALT